jgi:hypothetical protein
MLLSPVATRRVTKDKVKKANTPPPSSTTRIFTGMPILNLDDREPSLNDYSADSIPKHFSLTAKELIKKLLGEKIYHHVAMTSPKNTWASKVEPFHLSFHSRHPTLSTIDNQSTVYCDIMTNIDASGGVSYQIKDFQNVLHYIEIGKITYANLQSIHRGIIAPHLQALEEDKPAQSPLLQLKKRNSI